jgi:Tfp pilus assembly protein PilV
MTPHVKTNDRHHRAPTRAAGQRGVSLIEALLALVVMAIGMLAVVGMQATLRGNGDLSRQRAEAVRLAQASIDDWRAMVAVGTNAGVDYLDIGTDGPTDVTPVGANATYSRTRTVIETPINAAVAALPANRPMKSLQVVVTWKDRTDATQQVTLQTMVARVAPELAGSLAVPPHGVPARQPLGRNVVIPVAAIPQTDGTSKFTPPQREGQQATWVFNNTTGVITRFCTNATDNATCTDTQALFLQGYVRFALPAAVNADLAAVPSAASYPPSSVADLAALVAPAEIPLTAALTYTTTSSANVYTTDCFVGASSSEANAPTEYFCAIPLYPGNGFATPVWTGQIALGPADDLVATAADDKSAKRVRVCRYFDLTGNGTFSGVGVPLAQRSLLVVRAGNGAVAYGCGVPGVVKAHQPS